MTLRLRPAEPTDGPALAELLRLCLGDGEVPRSAAYLAWKHRDNPFGPSLTLLAEDGGRPVAFRAFLRWGLEDGRGRALQAVRSVDSATHPDWRRRGLFSRLTEQLVERATEAGVSFVFNTPNRGSAAGYRKLGWQPAGRARVRLRPLGPVFLGTVLARRDGAAEATPPPLADATAAQLFAAADDEPRLARLLRPRRTAGDALHTRRDAAYLAWRYAAVPGLRYHARWRCRDAAAAALVYRARRRRGGLEVTLAELLFTTGGEAIAAELLRELAGDAAGWGASHLLAVAAARTAEGAVLSRTGFSPALPLGPHLVSRPLAAPRAPRRWRDWQLHAGDLELF